MNKRYGVDYFRLGQIKSAITRMITIMVIGILFGLFGIYMLATLNDVDKVFRTEDYNMQKTIGIIALIGGGISVTLIFDILKNQRKYDNMLRSYIQIDDDVVQGVSFIDQCQGNGGTSFSVPYSSIRNAVASRDGQPLNLTIYTQCGTYTCLEIEKPDTVADQINQMVAQKKRAAEEQRRMEERRRCEAMAGLIECKYCLKCGVKLPLEAKYCGKCGAKQG